MPKGASKTNFRKAKSCRNFADLRVVEDRLPAAVEVPVGLVLVCHDDVLGMGDVLGEAPHVPHTQVRDHLGGDVPGRPVTRTDDHCLVLRSAVHSLRVAPAPVRLRIAKVGLVDFNGDFFLREILGDGERRFGVVLADLAQAMVKKPRAFMGHYEIAAHVKRGVFAQVAAEQVHADGSLLAGEVRRLHGSSRLHREPPVAVYVRAAMGARPVRLRCRPAGRSALGADGAVGPDGLLEPEAGGPFDWKHFCQFD